MPRGLADKKLFKGSWARRALYPDGFEVTLDCPNNRYVNDEEICIALAAIWAPIKAQLKINGQARTLFFPKVEKLDIRLCLCLCLCLFGWGGAVTDAESTVTARMRSRGDKGVGLYNYGTVHIDKFDALAAASRVEVYKFVVMQWVTITK